MCRESGFTGGGFMKYRFRLMVVLLVFTQLACTQLPNAASQKGVNASDEELLATLASLAKRGSDAVCNPAVVEKELGIKLGEFRIDKTPSLAGEPRESQWTDQIAPASGGKIFRSARYIRGRSNSGASCQIRISFFEDRLCDTALEKTQKIMGVAVKSSAFASHGDFYAYFYEYVPITGRSSEISVGLSNRKCANEFTLTTVGEWK